VAGGGAVVTIRVVVLEGDQTGQELLEQALRVLDPVPLGLEIELERFDLSLESRRSSSNEVVTEAAAAMRAAGLGIKAATITPEGADDVGSPNRILREQVDGKVIVLTGPAASAVEQTRAGVGTSPGSAGSRSAHRGPSTKLPWRLWGRRADVRPGWPRRHD
jgi:isocitrate dehydrogenase (NAD+)